MNAPKSGLFALILLLSFILHSLLTITASQNVIQKNNIQQSQMIINQLSQESAIYLEDKNFIALSTLAERYATLPSVASLQVYDVDEQQVIHVGQNKTLQTTPYIQNVKINNKVVGHIELSLSQSQYSEIFSAIWWTLLVSLLLHLTIWLVYIFIIRPRRSEYTQYLVTQQQVEQEIAHLKQELQNEREQITQLLSEYEIYQQTPDKQPEQEQLVLVIQYFDPNQLMRNLSPILLQKYFQTCQVLLQRSVIASCQQFNISPEHVMMLESFNQYGAKISINQDIEYATECLVMIQNLTDTLLDTLYKIYRQNKKFALNINSAIAEVSANEDAVMTAQRLLHYLKAQQKAVYLKHDRLKLITTSYKLMSFENPSNSLMRQSYLIAGMSAEMAQVVAKLRAEILHTPQ